MGKHKNNYKSKNGRYYVLKGSNAVMIAYNWDQANECFRKYICSPKRQISHCSYLDAQHDALNHLREIAPGLPIPLELLKTPAQNSQPHKDVPADKKP